MLLLLLQLFAPILTPTFPSSSCKFPKPTHCTRFSQDARTRQGSMELEAYGIVQANTHHAYPITLLTH